MSEKIPSSGQTGKHVLNTNMNIRNLIDMNSYVNQRIFTDTLKEIIELLTSHCGPYSKYGMIVTDGGIGSNVISPNVFTKDGIKLLKSIEYASIIQTYIKNTIAFVGEEVDQRAKDGTTTAMIAAASFLCECLRSKNKIDEYRLTTTEKENIYKDFVEDVIDNAEQYAYNLDKLVTTHPSISKNKLAGIIAYMQALSSSGGNTDLANCIKTIFEETPEEAWDYQVWSKSLLENDTPFFIKREPFDYDLVVDFQTMDILNTNFNTEWVEEDVYVLSIPDNVVDSPNNFTTSNIFNFIKEFPEDKTLCVLVQNASARLSQHVSELNTTRKKRIAFAHIFERERSLSSVCLDLAGLCAVASATPYIREETTKPIDIAKHVFIAKKVRYVAHEMEFYGIVKGYEDKTTFYIHPDYQDGTIPLAETSSNVFYTDLMHDLKTRISKMNIGHKKDHELKHKLITTVKKMMCMHVPTLCLGGNVHDLLANESLVQDVIGATMTSLRGNFFISGVYSMFNVITTFITNLQSFHEKDDLTADAFLFKMDLTEFFYNAIKTVVSILKNNISEDNNMIGGGNFPVLMPEEYTNLLDPKKQVHKLDDFLAKMEYLDQMESDDFPIIQPVVIYREILNRMGELLLRLVSTSKIVVPGGAYVNAEE